MTSLNRRWVRRLGSFLLFGAGLAGVWTAGAQQKPASQAEPTQGQQAQQAQPPQPAPKAPEPGASAAGVLAGQPGAAGAIVAAVLTTGALTMLLLVGTLRADAGRPGARPWSLAEALSEEVQLTDDAGKTKSVLVSSSSRLVAVIGLAAYLPLYLAIAGLALADFAIHGRASEGAKSLLQWLSAGIALFVPYAFNQVRSAFEDKAGKDGDKPAPKAGDGGSPKPGDSPKPAPLPGGRTT